VQVTADRVSISGERTIEPKTEDKTLLRSEFRYGRFERIIPLPVPVQFEQVNAEYSNGILSLTLPKSEITRKNVVRVNVG
jgi:HSP20 family protein